MSRPHENKNCVRVYDYADTHVPVLRAMHTRRLATYRTLGFALDHAGELVSAPRKRPAHGPDNADPDHTACAAALTDSSPLVATELVVAETAYLVGRQLGAAAEAAFFRLTTIATLDRRHFGVVRPSRAPGFALVP